MCNRCYFAVTNDAFNIVPMSARRQVWAAAKAERLRYGHVTQQCVLWMEEVVSGCAEGFDWVFYDLLREDFEDLQKTRTTPTLVG